MKKNPLAKLHANKKGAVLVEFLVALMPLMITFSCFVQVSQIARTRLMVKHSAIVAARAAAVISNEHKNTPDQKAGKNEDIVRASVLAALGPFNKVMAGSPTVTINDKSSCDDPYGTVDVTVNATMRCTVPFGGRLLCGGGLHGFRQTYSMPHQGARYKDGQGGGC